MVDDGSVHELVISSDGAVVYDPVNDVVVREHPIDPEVLARIVGQVAEASPQAGFAIERAGQFIHTAGFADDRGVTVSSLTELVRDRVVKLLIRDGRLTLDELLALVDRLAGTDAQATHSGYTMVEV